MYTCTPPLLFVSVWADNTPCFQEHLGLTLASWHCSGSMSISDSTKLTPVSTSFERGTNLTLVMDNTSTCGLGLPLGSFPTIFASKRFCLLQIFEYTPFYSRVKM